MPFTSEKLRNSLSALAAGNPPDRYVVAFSGGLDSTVLLHALNAVAADSNVSVVAIHVRHDLHEDAVDWEAHCRSAAGDLEIAFECVAVAVDRDAGFGPEAAARTARYAALQQRTQAGDWLLSAHHQDDQAETLLLNLMRGSGVAGMAGIGALQEFGAGQLCRPLLQVSRDDLHQYALAHSLHWLDDPSNADTVFDRNFVRHAILPALTGRWPAAVSRLARSADLAGEASELLEQLADDDLLQLGDAQRINIAALSKLSDARQRNVLRRALKRLGLSVAPATRLRQIIDELIPARADAEPRVHWPGAEARRYRDFIYLLPEFSDQRPAAVPALDNSERSIDLGRYGRLSLRAGPAVGIRQEVIERGLRVDFRRGGEEICPFDHARTHKLKKLLQQQGIVPWMRDRIPLLYSADRLVAVADLWVAADVADEKGLRVLWEDHPAIV